MNYKSTSITILSLYYKKYGVVVRAGIIRSLSGTALNSLASLLSACVKDKMAATLPQR